MSYLEKAREYLHNDTKLADHARQLCEALKTRGGKYYDHHDHEYHSVSKLVINVIEIDGKILYRDGKILHDNACSPAALRYSATSLLNTWICHHPTMCRNALRVAKNEVYLTTAATGITLNQSQIDRLDRESYLRLEGNIMDTDYWVEHMVILTIDELRELVA